MSARERILARVRSALEGREAPGYPGPFEGWRPTDDRSGLERFRELFEAAGGEVHHFPSEIEGSAWVRDFVSDFEGVSIGKLARFPLNHGAEVDDRIEPSSPAEASVGVSLATAAIAETGSLLMSATDGRREQLLPPTHVVFVEEESLYATLTEALDAVASDLPSALGLHSGPSKSADIGQVLVKGVHGPGRLIAVILGNDDARPSS